MKNNSFSLVLMLFCLALIPLGILRRKYRYNPKKYFQISSVVVFFLVAIIVALGFLHDSGDTHPIHSVRIRCVSPDNIGGWFSPIAGRPLTPIQQYFDWF